MLEEARVLWRGIEPAERRAGGDADGGGDRVGGVRALRVLERAGVVAPAEVERGEGGAALELGVAPGVAEAVEPLDRHGEVGVARDAAQGGQASAGDGEAEGERGHGELAAALAEGGVGGEVGAVVDLGELALGAALEAVDGLLERADPVVLRC